MMKSRKPRNSPAASRPVALNSVEKVWQHLRDRWLSHRVLPSYQAVLDAACQAWNALCVEPDRLRSLTSFPWLPESVGNS